MSPYMRGMRFAGGGEDEGDSVEVYQTIFRRWRWKRVDADGNTIAKSGTGYKTQQECWDNLSLALDDNYTVDDEGETP